MTTRWVFRSLSGLSPYILPDRFIPLGSVSHVQVADNTWKGGSALSNNTEAGTIDGVNFTDRKRNAVKAYFEWTPMYVKRSEPLTLRLTSLQTTGGYDGWPPNLAKIPIWQACGYFYARYSTIRPGHYRCLLQYR